MPWKWPVNSYKVIFETFRTCKTFITVPQKGNPKRGIRRKTNMFEWLKSVLKWLLGDCFLGSPFRIPLWGTMIMSYVFLSSYLNKFRDTCMLIVSCWTARQTSAAHWFLVLGWAIPVSVNKTTPLDKDTCGKVKFKAPNQGKDRSLGCWIAWSRLAQKECFFKDAGMLIISCWTVRQTSAARRLLFFGRERYIYIYIYIYICISLSLYLYIYIYIYIRTHV